MYRHTVGTKLSSNSDTAFCELTVSLIFRKASLFAGAQGQKGHTEAIHLSVLGVLVILKDVVNNRQDLRLRGWTVQFPATTTDD